MTGNNTDPDDMVNHPLHYNTHKSGVECIDVVEHMGFNLGSVVKYVWRADEKGNDLEDLRKAKFYIERELARREAATDSTAERLEELKPLQDVFAEMPKQMQPEVSIYGVLVHNTFHTDQQGLKYSHMTRVIDDALVVVHPHSEYKERKDCMIGKQLVERSLHKTMNEYIEYVVVDDFAGKVTDVAERYPEEQQIESSMKQTEWYPATETEPSKTWVGSGHQVKLNRENELRVEHPKEGCPRDETCTVYQDLTAMPQVKTSLEHHLGMWFDVMVDDNINPVLLQTDRTVRVKL